jgi:hypothetical protein
LAATSQKPSAAKASDGSQLASPALTRVQTAAPNRPSRPCFARRSRRHASKCRAIPRRFLKTAPT